MLGGRGEGPGVNKRRKTFASPSGGVKGGRKEGSGAIARFKLGRATNLQRQGEGEGREPQRGGERKGAKERGRDRGKERERDSETEREGGEKGR